MKSQLLLIVGSLVLPVAAAAGQTAPGAGQRDPADEHQWEVEVYAGGIGGGGRVEGTAMLPPPGPVITESFGGFSQTIPTFPSWYFGAGAAYLNGGLSRLVSPISPLDPVLTRAPGVRSPNLITGFRITHQFTNRWRWEAAAEHRPGPVEVDDDARAQIESTRASFENLFRGSPLPGFADVSSTASVEAARGSVIVVTGAFSFDLRSRGRVSHMPLLVPASHHVPAPRRA